MFGRLVRMKEMVILGGVVLGEGEREWLEVDRVVGGVRLESLIVKRWERAGSTDGAKNTYLSLFDASTLSHLTTFRGSIECLEIMARVGLHAMEKLERLVAGVKWDSKDDDAAMSIIRRVFASMELSPISCLSSLLEPQDKISAQIDMRWDVMELAEIFGRYRGLRVLCMEGYPVCPDDGSFPRLLGGVRGLRGVGLGRVRDRYVVERVGEHPPSLTRRGRREPVNGETSIHQFLDQAAVLLPWIPCTLRSLAEQDRKCIEITTVLNIQYKPGQAVLNLLEVLK
ncbi:hypothetical protein BDV98DRAFT_658228 [Pterulicium gracile]|uniref:Uncharacterized protein n=1 Tax=Pterulicium gracile TaxID=1884261 RepID=A0A5C3Q7R3_9AGAR|nr:hypothetical protein BDV98DRAFT_658228 [Pterula gracilis]